MLLLCGPYPMVLLAAWHAPLVLQLLCCSSCAAALFVLFVLHSRRRQIASQTLRAIHRPSSHGVLLSFFFFFSLGGGDPIRILSCGAHLCRILLQTDALARLTCLVLHAWYSMLPHTSSSGWVDPKEQPAAGDHPGPVQRRQRHLAPGARRARHCRGDPGVLARPRVLPLEAGKKEGEKKR